MYTLAGRCGCNQNGGYLHGDDWRMVTSGAPTAIEVVGFTINGRPIVVGQNSAKPAASTSGWGWFLGAAVLLGLGALAFSQVGSRTSVTTVGGARTRARRKGLVQSVVSKYRKTGNAKKSNANAAKGNNAARSNANAARSNANAARSNAPKGNNATKKSNANAPRSNAVNYPSVSGGRSAKARKGTRPAKPKARAGRK